jgi:DNA primase
MFISDDIVQQIKNDADIVEIISEYVNLKKRGKNYVGLSPFTNEKTASFIVSPDKQIFKDFSSGKGGDLFTFLMEYRRITFHEAITELADKLNIEIKSTPNSSVQSVQKSSKRKQVLDLLEDVKKFYINSMRLDENHIAIEYFLKRGFTVEVQKKFELCYAPDSWEGTVNHLKKKGYNESLMLESGVIGKSKSNTLYDRFKGRAIFPIKDHLGKVIGFGGRDLTNSPKAAKYINSPQSLVYDKSDVLYGFYEGIDDIRNTEEAILVEGYADVVSLSQAGITNVVAVSGTALTEKHCNRLKRYVKTVYLNFDSDRAGISAADKSIDICLENEIDVQIIELPEGEDPDSIVRQKGKKEYELLIRKSISFVEFRVKEFKVTWNKKNPKSLSDFLEKMIATINKIKNVFVHDHYLKQLTDLLDLSESEKVLLYEQKNKSHVNKENNLKLVKNTSDWHPEAMLVELKKELTDAEIKIFSYLLDSKDIKSQMEELQLSPEFFQSDTGMKIYDHLEMLDFDNSEGLIQQIIHSEEADDDLNSLLTSIIVLKDEFKPSEQWDKFRHIDPVKMDKLIEEAIRKIMLENLESEINDLLSSIEDNPENDKLFANYNELIKRREKMYENPKD